MGAGIGLLLPWENGIEVTGTGNGKKCQNGNGINIFEHWEVEFVKHMGWEMGLEPPLRDPFQKLIGGEPFCCTRYSNRNMIRFYRTIIIH